MSERRVSHYLLTVNDFCKYTNEIFEFQGCVFHGCGKGNANRDSNGNLKELNCFGKLFKCCKNSFIKKFEEEGLQFTIFMNVNGKRC